MEKHRKSIFRSSHQEVLYKEDGCGDLAEGVICYHSYMLETCRQYIYVYINAFWQKCGMSILQQPFAEHIFL